MQIPPSLWGLQNKGQEINGKKGLQGIDINIIKAWEYTKGNADIIVGILDTGIQIDSVYLQDSIYINDNEIPNNGIDDDNNGYIDDINGWNFFNNNNMIYDSYLHDYHGTYISGIISSSKTDALIGIAPNVKILPLKFISGSKGEIQDAIDAIAYAHKIGVRIINCSWDGIKYDENLKKVIEQYSDILFICSAGKYMDDLNNTPVYPACYELPNVISVAAVDNRGELYEFTGYGDKADVAAPGVDIYSIMPDGDFTYSSGTSPATAYVTGVAALILSYKPDINTISLANIIKKGKKSIKSLKNKVSSGGIIDAYECLKLVDR